MSGFTQHIDSPFPDENILFNSASGITGQQIQQNQLGIQQKQLDLTAADHEQVGRLAAGLLNIQDPAARAQAYSRGVGMLQSQGLAKYAPPTLPDEQSLKMLVAQTVPAQTQAEWLANIQANKAYGAATTPAMPASGSTPAPPATTPPGSGATIGQRQNNPGNLTFAGQPGASPGQGNRFASFPDMPTGVAANADQLALYQTQHGINTVRGAVTRWVSDPKADLTSYIGDISKALGVGPDDKIDLTDPAVQAKFIQAQFPHESAGGGYVLSPADVAKGVQMAAANRGRTVQAPGTAVATATPTTAQPGQPVPTQVAGPPMVSTAPASPTAAPAPALPPPNQVAPGGVNGPPAPAPAPAPTAQPSQPGVRQPPQPPQPPSAAPLPSPPQMPVLNARGLTPQQQAQIDALASTGRMTVQQRMAAEQAFVTQNVQLRQQAFSDYMQQQQLQVQQGTLDNARYEANLKAWQAANPVPTTPRFGPGAAVWNPTTAGWEQPTPATQADAVQGHWGVNNTGQQQFFPDATVPAEGGYKNMETAYKRDSENITGIGAEGRTLQADQIRVQEMRNILQTVNTGSGAETQAAIQAFLQKNMPSALTNWTTNYANLDGPAAIQMFQKLGFMGATSQEQQTTPRGGYLATKLFQQFNPGAQLLTSTNQGLLAQRLISNQAGIDYSQGAQDHFGQQEQNFTSSKPSYSSLAQYDRQWQAQRNPQVYAAAIGALGQQDYAQWSKNLSAPEIEAALDVIHRADPNAIVNGQSGRLNLSTKGQPQGQMSAPATSGTQAAPTRVIQYDASGKRL